MEILCFYAGIAFFYDKNAFSLALLFIMVLLRKQPKLILWFSAALGWCWFHQWLIADHGMPTTRLVSKAVLTGYITTIPNQTATKTQFQFLAETLNQQPVKAAILLTCYQHCPPFQAGQYWQLTAKLKKPINLANPGHFDFERWLYSRHIQWLGTIQAKTSRLLAQPSLHFTLLKWRERWSQRLAQINPHPETLGIFQALTIGLTHEISQAQWTLFRRTGTTHLIDISGEHIAMLAGLMFWLLKQLISRLGQFCLYCPAPKFASIGAIIFTTGYALIAGFSAPTQRALIMCILMLSRYFYQQQIGIWQNWRYALLLVLLFEPHSVQMIGFYFSFLAVAILILLNQRSHLRGLWQTITLQSACLIGLMPLSLFWFSYGSFNGLFTNLIAIPLVSLLIVPLALIIAFFSPWGMIPGSVTLLNMAIHGLLTLLTWLDSLAFLNIQWSLPTVAGLLALMLTLTISVLLPVPRLLPSVAILAWCGLFPHYPQVKQGEARIDVLDVGQGLAAVIHTAHHILVYDTGMKFYSSSDMAKLALIPYLQTWHTQTIDAVVISHPDLDHRGGLNSLADAYPIQQLFVDEPAFYHHGETCHQAQSWHWDGVTFQFLPIKAMMDKKNNHSCILRISNRFGSVLFSGDIEKKAEHYLIATYGKNLASTGLIIPHHGSKTSSSLAFLTQVAPRFAIASYGFDNRYHFPHQQTIHTYQTRHIPIYNTADHGMISVFLNAQLAIQTMKA